MTHDPTDRDLKNLFQALREEDRRRTPEFDVVFGRARRVRRVWRPASLLWKGGLLAAAAAAVLLLVRSPGTSDEEFERVVQAFTSDPASGAWRSPTDDLLKLPGLEILSSVPSLGDERWPGTPGGSPRGNQL